MVGCSNKSKKKKEKCNLRGNWPKKAAVMTSQMQPSKSAAAALYE